MRHRAAFHDLLLLVGRVNAYRQRLEDLKGRARGVPLRLVSIGRGRSQATHEARPGEAPMQRRFGLLAPRDLHVRGPPQAGRKRFSWGFESDAGP